MTAQPKEQDRLRHMLDAAKEATEFVKSRQRSDLDTDHQLALALTRLVEIIGEASRHVSEETKQRNPKIRWKEIAGTRARLAHGYFDVDLDILWEIVTADLSPLIDQLKRLVPK